MNQSAALTRVLQFDPTLQFGYEIVPSVEKSVYHPAHFVEPVEANILMLDFDVSTFNGGAHYIEQALSTYQPVVSALIPFFPGAPMEDEQNSILLFHPGIPLESRPDLNPKGLALLVTCHKHKVRHRSHA